MRVYELAVDDEEWPRLLRQCDFDVHHLPGWSRSFAIEGHGVASAVVVESVTQLLLCPILRRELPSGRHDLTSPYGYGSAVVSRNAAPDFFGRAIAAAAEYLRSAGAVSWFIRNHPGLPLADGPGLLVDHGPTVVVDLARPAEELLAEMRSGHRYEIRKAVRSGVTVSREPLSRVLDVFEPIYLETMDRVGASDTYRFEPGHYQSLIEGLGSHLWMLCAWLEGQPIAASLFTHGTSMGLVGYHLSGTVSEFLNLQPSKLILYEAIKQGLDTGHRYLHLGGGLGGESDSLFTFKQGFSAATWRFTTRRLVLDTHGYRELCASAGVHPTGGGFFPAYRAPVPS